MNTPINYRFRLDPWLVVIFILTVSLACNVAPASLSLTGNQVTLANCYDVRFLGFSQDADGTSTWRYQVDELSCGQEMKNWTLEIPACATVVEASPASWEPVQTELNLPGVRWQTVPEFQGGDFSVKLSGNVIRGPIHVDAQGQTTASGEIQGPICNGAAPAAFTFTPATTTVTSTITPTVTIITATLGPTAFVPTRVPTDVPTRAPLKSPTPVPPTAVTTSTKATTATPTMASTKVNAATPTITSTPPQQNTPAPTNTSAPTSASAPTQASTPIPAPTQTPSKFIPPGQTHHP